MFHGLELLFLSASEYSAGSYYEDLLYPWERQQDADPANESDNSCAFQLVYGRLSDIFGRKNMLQAALCLLILGDMLCSFAQTPIQLYAFRAIGGIGGGGVTNIAMVIVSRH